MSSRSQSVILACIVLLTMLTMPLLAQQKGQWVPAQYGLNAGVVPEPGLTYQNLALNYSAGQLNDSQGNRLPSLTGTYSFWVDESILMYVPNKKILGGYYAPYINLNVANGSLVATITGTSLSSNGGGSGFADTFVVPLNFGWHFSRADFNAGNGFFAPTGRYTAGAPDNIGSGYWGNTLLSGTTFYITKDKGTSANLFVDWEGARQEIRDQSHSRSGLYDGMGSGPGPAS